MYPFETDPSRKQSVCIQRLGLPELDIQPASPGSDVARGCTSIPRLTLQLDSRLPSWFLNNQAQM